MELELFEAARQGNCEEILYWLEAGADINFRKPDWKGATPLFAAVKHGHEKAVELLISQGADVNAYNRDGWGALHMGVEVLSPAILCRLFASGARLTGDCQLIARQQPDGSLEKRVVLSLLEWAYEQQHTYHLIYFLPIIYANTLNETIQVAKQNIVSAYHSSNVVFVTEQVDQAYDLDPSFHILMPAAMRRIVRRFGLLTSRVERLCSDLAREDLQNNSRLLDSVVTRFRPTGQGIGFEPQRGTRRNSLHTAWQCLASA